MALDKMFEWACLLCRLVKKFSTFTSQSIHWGHFSHHWCREIVFKPCEHPLTQILVFFDLQRIGRGWFFFMVVFLYFCHSKTYIFFFNLPCNDCVCFGGWIQIPWVLPLYLELDILNMCVFYNNVHHFLIYFFFIIIHNTIKKLFFKHPLL